MSHRTLTCVDGRLMRSDPQPDDPYLQTDMGKCPDCDGRGCEPPKAQHVALMAIEHAAYVVTFDKPLTDEEIQDFGVYVREWAP